MLSRLFQDVGRPASADAAPATVGLFAFQAVQATTEAQDATPVMAHSTRLVRLRLISVRIIHSGLAPQNVLPVRAKASFPFGTVPSKQLGKAVWLRSSGSQMGLNLEAQ
jgi:hypothetical protein